MLSQILIAALLFQLLTYRPFGKWLFSGIRNAEQRYNYVILFQRFSLVAMFLMVILSADHVYKPSQFIENDSNLLVGVITVLLCLVVVVVNFAFLSKAKNPVKTLRLPAAANHRSYFVLNTVTWIIYLFAYEYLIRGVFFNFLLDSETVFVAVAVNVLFYAFLHIQQSWGELFGSIPFGIVLCWITIYSGSVLPAIAIHITFALSHDYWSIYIQQKGVQRNQ